MSEELREQLEAAYDAAASNESENDELEDTEAPEIEASDDDADEGEQQISTDQSETEGKEIPQQEQLEAPQFWSDEYKARFNSITDPELKKYLINREKESQSNFTRARQEAAELQRAKAEYDAIVSQHSEAIRASGMTPTQYMNALMLANQQLMNDPLSGLRQMADALGITPQQFLAEQQAQQNDPRYDALQRQVLEVQQWKVAQERERAMQEAARIEQERERLVSEIDSAISAKLDDGSAKFPFIEREDVLPEVAALVKTYRELAPGKSIPDLIEKAYKKAIADNPEIQSVIQAEQNQKRQAAEAAKVKAAKAAGKSISGTATDNDVEEDDVTDLRAMLERGASKLGMK